MTSPIETHSDEQLGSFSLPSARAITVPADPGYAAVMCHVHVEWSQLFSRVFELTPPRVYYVAGKISGRAHAGAVIIPRQGAKDFLLAHTPTATSPASSIQLTPHANGRAFTLGNAAIMSIPAGITMRDVVVNESMGMVFSSFLHG